MRATLAILLVAAVGPAAALGGVLVGPSGRSDIFAADGRKPLVVAVGGHIDAWTVRSIEADAVEVSGPGGAGTLHPSFASPSGASPSVGSSFGGSSFGASPSGASGGAMARRRVGLSSTQ